MAGEVTSSTTANDIYFAAWVSSTVLEEVRPYLGVAKPLVRYEGRKPTLAFDFPIQDRAAGASGIGEAWTEQADYPGNNALRVQTTSKATATSTMKGSAAIVSDVIDAIALVDAVSHFASVLGRAVSEKEEVDLNAQWDNFSNATTSTTVLLLDDFMAAIGALEARDATGDLVAVLHPKQVSDLRRDLTGTVAASFFGSEKGAGVVGDALPNAKLGGAVGNIAGVDVFQTSTVPTSTDLKGGMFVKGVTNGMYQVWDARTESHREALQPSTILATTVHYGLAEIRDTWGQEIASDP
jgi:hypothetical protein